MFSKSMIPIHDAWAAKSFPIQIRKKKCIPKIPVTQVGVITEIKTSKLANKVAIDIAASSEAIFGKIDLDRAPGIAENRRVKLSGIV